MGLYHGWDDEKDTHADFVRGGVPIEDFEEDFKYKKPGRSNWNKRRNRICKKSKNGEKCDFSARRVKGSMWNRERTGYVPRYIITCSRCSKEDWRSSYSWFW